MNLRLTAANLHQRLSRWGAYPGEAPSSDGAMNLILFVLRVLVVVVAFCWVECSSTHHPKPEAGPSHHHAAEPPQRPWWNESDPDSTR
jgi:hypothetical protein